MSWAAAKASSQLAFGCHQEACDTVLNIGAVLLFKP